MGSKSNKRQRLSYHFLLSLLFLSILSSTQFKLMAQGRSIPQLKKPVLKERLSNEENKVMVRARIGSRPPRCERRCSSCGHCEAIQVPTNPQLKFGNNNNNNNNNNNESNNYYYFTKTNSSSFSNVKYYSRGYDNSNYKPMSWKCKCGDYIFNP